MGFWKEIADELVTDESLQQLDRKQCEAIIDAMTLLVYADGEASFLERQELDLLLHELPWALREGDAVDVYLEKSSACMKEAAARGDDGVREAAEGIAGRLEGGPLRKRALKMAAAIAYANWDAGEAEYDALLTLADAFEIPAPFARAMLHDAGAEAGEVGDDDTDPTLVPSPNTRTIREVLSKNFLRGFFDGLFDDDDLHHLSEDASYAFVDALSVALIADGYPEVEELQEFKAQLENLPFAPEDAEQIRARVEMVINTMRESTDDEADAYIAGIGARIEPIALREKALEMSALITHADLDVTAEETTILHRMAEGFGLSTQKMNAIIKRVTDAEVDDFLD